SVRRRMQRIRKTDTKPERIVRRLVTQLGVRYRLHRRDIPGSPDLAFIGRKKLIFVHGCFWHQHDCALGKKQPSTRREYWVPKLMRNVARDAEVQKDLVRDGWDVMTIWECETSDEVLLSRTLRLFLIR